MTLSIHPARPADCGAVLALLQAESLPLEGVEEHFGSFVVAEDSGALVGAAGIEVYGDAALLRSVVVAPPAKGRGVGSALIRHMIEGARARALREIFLLTTTAAAFFPRFGFQPAHREGVPPMLQSSHEFRGACPASAVLMRLVLD